MIESDIQKRPSSWSPLKSPRKHLNSSITKRYCNIASHSSYISGIEVDDPEECKSSNELLTPKSRMLLTDQGDSSPEPSIPKKQFKEMQTIESKLQKARERREEINEMRKIALRDKKRQILQAEIRASQNLEDKKEKVRKEYFKIAQVKARRSDMKEEKRRRILESLEQAAQRVIQQKEFVVEKARQESSIRVAEAQARRSATEVHQRQQALLNIENKINQARTRADKEIQKKQDKARCERRSERVRKKRHLLELERRTSILINLGRRHERAELYLQSRLHELQNKASQDIIRAIDVSRRVRASRVIQRAFRKTVLGTSLTKKYRPKMSEEEAAVVLQSFFSWHLAVMCRQFKDDISSGPKASLSFILGNVAPKGPRRDELSPAFDRLSMIIQQEPMILAAKELITAFRSLLGKNAHNIPISERTVLSAFLVSEEPIMVFGPKRDNDLCSQLLEKSSLKLVSYLNCIMTGNENSLPRILKETASCLVSYCTLFEYWKNADADDLVAELQQNAVQSWVALLTANRVLRYLDSKSQDSEPCCSFFQHQLKFKSSKKGSTSHIKRIRSSLEKLLGSTEAAIVLKHAKEEAVLLIEKEKLFDGIKVSLDESFEDKSPPSPTRSRSSMSEQNVVSDYSVDLDYVNEYVVHEMLLTDSDDLKEQLCKAPEESIVDDVDLFMMKYSSRTNNDSITTEYHVAMTMEKAFYDKLLEEWIKYGEMICAKDMLREMIDKMKKLVPNRKDLHGIFSNQHLDSCRTASDVLKILTLTAEIMADSLESPYRAESTLQWLHATGHLSSTQSEVPFNMDNIETFIVYSIAFFMKKLDLCHADILNFRLLEITPMIQQNGVDYERKRFQKKFSTDNLQATSQWIQRIVSSLDRPASIWQSSSLFLKQGFVEEILFVRKSVALPEVFLLDRARINSIREIAQRLVISSALFLHACIITKTRPTSLTEDNQFLQHKDAVLSSLKSNLTYEKLYENVSSALLALAEATRKKTLEDSEIQKIHHSIDSVLKGNDPIVALMDKRIRDVFRSACTYSPSNTVQFAPPMMRTGVRSNIQKQVNTFKFMFGVDVAKNAMKLGFNFVIDDVVEAAYDAYKVIDHCIHVHEEYVFKPLISELLS